MYVELPISPIFTLETPSWTHDVINKWTQVHLHLSGSKRLPRRRAYLLPFHHQSICRLQDLLLAVVEPASLSSAKWFLLCYADVFVLATPNLSSSLRLGRRCCWPDSSVTLQGGKCDGNLWPASLRVVSCLKRWFCALVFRNATILDSCWIRAPTSRPEVDYAARVLLSFFHLFRPLLFGLIIGRRCDRTWSGPGSNSTHHRQVVSPRSSFTLCQLMCQDFLCLDILYALRVCYTQLAFRKCWFLLKTSLLRDIDSYFCSPWPSSGHFSSCRPRLEVIYSTPSPVVLFCLFLSVLALFNRLLLSAADVKWPGWKGVNSYHRVFVWVALGLTLYTCSHRRWTPTTSEFWIFMSLPV